MVVQVGGLAGILRLEVGLVLAGRERRRGEETHALVQHRDIAGGADVVRREVGEPDEVVGESGADAPREGRVPPVEHVPLHELMRGVEQDLLAGEPRPEGHERGRILELIAEPVRAARLVEGGAPPDAAGQRLIGEPAVHHEIEGGGGRGHAQSGDALSPEVARGLEGARRGFRRAVAREDLAGRGGAPGLSEQEDDLADALGGNFEHDLLGDAWIQRRPRAAVEGSGVAQRPRRRRVASAADEALPIARRVHGAHPRRGDHGGEGHRFGERHPRHDCARRPPWKRDRSR